MIIKIELRWILMLGSWTVRGSPKVKTTSTINNYVNLTTVEWLLHLSGGQILRRTWYDCMS